VSLINRQKMTARINSRGTPAGFGLQGAVYDRNKNIGQFADPYRPSPATGAIQTSAPGDWTLPRVPIQAGRPVVQARNPLTYVSPDMNRPEMLPQGQPMPGNSIPGPGGQQAMPVPAGMMGVAPPTELKQFSGGYADARSAAMLNNAGMDEMLARQGRGMKNMKNSSILQQAQNTMHLTRYGQGFGKYFGPQYYIAPLGGGTETDSAKKFLKNASTFANEYEKKHRYHSTVTELQHSAAVIKGMEPLPQRNPLLAVPRAAMVGSNRPVNFNTRYGDSRPEVPSVERNSQYPTDHLFMMQDRGAGSFADKEEWLIVQQKQRSTGFYALDPKARPMAQARQVPMMHKQVKYPVMPADRQAGAMRRGPPLTMMQSVAGQQ
jgi:hypothetical protein